jgi:shikimate kinase
MLIFLIGFMGSGKTTTGRMLAGSLQYDFADLDQLIEEHEGIPITEIFARKGEDHFRKTEAEVLDSLVGRERLVVACGGGTACFHDNMQKMKSAGITLYIKVSPALLARRLATQHSTRPLVAGMQGDRLKNHIRKLLAGREGWYRQSHIIYDADKFNLQEVLDLISNFAGPQR